MEPEEIYGTGRWVALFAIIAIPGSIVMLFITKDPIWMIIFGGSLLLVVLGIVFLWDEFEHYFHAVTME